MKTYPIAFTINGRQEHLEVPSNLTLLYMIREKLSLTGTKNGCEAGECGACTVLVNGEPVNSCMVLAVECDGAEIMTIEGLTESGEIEKLQESFMKLNAIQCGFCTPGMLVTAYAFLQRNPNPTREEIKEALVGNLCRCTGYERIVQAVQEALPE
jgi:carbon-monoxide dehydrogenase small subunit